MIEQRNANKKNSETGESQYVNFCTVWTLRWRLGYQFDYRVSINYADTRYTLDEAGLLMQSNATISYKVVQPGGPTYFI